MLDELGTKKVTQINNSTAYLKFHFTDQKN
jgi:hypothetical protein